MQAVVLHHKLPHLDGWNAKRVEGRRLGTPAARKGVGDLRSAASCLRASAPVWHLYVVRTRQPEGARGAFLARARRSAPGRHYPQPPHLSLRVFLCLGLPEGAKAPVTEALAREVPLAAALPGDIHESATGTGLLGDRGVFRAWPLAVAAPTTRLPTGSSVDVELRSDDVVVLVRRTSTAAGSATNTASGRSSRSRARNASARTARSRATPSSAPGHDRGRGVRRPRCRVRQRQAPRATNEEGTLQRRGGLGALPTIVERGASIGSGAVVLGGVRIGRSRRRRRRRRDTGRRCRTGPSRASPRGFAALRAERRTQATRSSPQRSVRASGLRRSSRTRRRRARCTCRGRRGLPGRLSACRGRAVRTTRPPRRSRTT